MIAGEWIRESMPTHWGIARVKDHARVVNGYPFDSKMFSTGAGYPLVRIRDISSSETVVRYDGEWVPEAAITTGDVLVGMDGDFNVARWNGGDALLNQRVCCIRTAESMHSGYLYYALPTPLQLINEFTYSTTVKHLSSFDVLDIRVPFPPIDQQKLIANYLDRETARIDGLIAEKERMLALLEEKRAALISRVVTRGLDPNAPLKPSGQEWLGEIPAHWGLQRLKQLAEVRGGLTLGKQYSGEFLEYPYLRVANVQDGYLKLDDVLTVEVPASEAASNLLAYGDVLMNEGGDVDKLGRGCVWRDEIAPCLHQNHVFAVRPHSVDSDWLALWTSTLQAKRYFESRAKRSTNLASISGSNIKELPVPLPPIAEQLAIQKFLANRHSRLEAVRKELRDSLRLLSERRAALITAAVTGQIPLETMRA